MSDVRRPLVAGNWKMNGMSRDGLALAEELARRVKSLAGTSGDRGGGDILRCDLLVCSPATLLWRVAQVLSDTPISVGGQDCHPEPSGAHTGDVSAEMLKDAGAAFVIVGHSERRGEHGESDELVRAKAEAAHEAGLCALICIGETEAERDGGKTLDVLARQLRGSVPQRAGAANTVIAYEPVWAIGAARTPGTSEIAAAHAHIRETLGARLTDAGNMRVLYGGSVNPSNAAAFLALPEVDGALVGGASLDADHFWAIARSCP